jgi:coronin-7
MDFHADIFPDVFAPWDGLDYMWLSGSDKIREKVSLDPSKQEWRQKLEENDVGEEVTSNESKDTKEEKSTTEETTPPIPLPTNTSPAIRPPSHPSSSTASQPSEVEAPPSLPSSSSTITSITSRNTTAPTKTLPSTYTRKFLIGRLYHPSKHYTSLPPTPTTTSLRRTLSVTSTHLAFPLAGPGGRIAILPLSNSGRNENPPTFSNGSALVDFSICPHRQRGDTELPMRIFCAGEDGRVTVVEIKLDDKGKEIVTEVVAHLEGVEKVIQGEWHPLASDLIAVLCHDSGKSEIRLWDVSKEGYRRIQLGYSVNCEMMRLMVGLWNCVEFGWEEDCCCRWRQCGSYYRSTR